GLLPGKTYEWQVKSYQSGATGNNSGWTTSETFTVVGGGLTKTVASYPVNTETIYDNEVTVSWYLDGSSMGFDEYYVRLVQSNSNPGNWHTVSNSFDANISNVNQTYRTFTDLEYGETYYWAVAFYDAEADALVSTDYSVGSFKIVGGNSTTITNTTPEDESVVYSSSPTVYWQVNGSGIGIQGYRVEYSETQLFVTGFVDEKISTINSVQLTDLTPGATYYWRVSFTYDDPNGSPVWSSASSATEFSVIAGSNSVTPQVQSPISGVTISDASPTLSWRLPVKSESNLVYEIELANNSNFNDAVKLDDVNSLKMKVASLGSGEYFWRVRSKVAGSKSTSVSAYSKVGSFVVDGVTGIEDGRIELVPSNFALEQNYPNPFNPTTSIRFTLPEAEFVSLKIYDMLGNEIRTVMNSDKSSGTHTAVWDGRDNGGSQVTSGTYIYRLTAGNNVEVRKMLLLK
ncbi:MAG: T9SS type A sorting domain-containing protein, partial [Melioribacteraceae bacterium]|nr:T9SS type A sorting domain-containing protein [Melioribacteraceae bacterium]